MTILKDMNTENNDIVNMTFVPKREMAHKALSLNRRFSCLNKVFGGSKSPKRPLKKIIQNFATANI